MAKNEGVRCDLANWPMVSQYLNRPPCLAALEAPRGLGIGVAGKKDAVCWFFHRGLGQVVSGGVLGGHASSHDELSAFIEINLDRLIANQD